MCKKFFILNQQEISAVTGCSYLDPVELIQELTGVTRTEAETAHRVTKILIGLLAIATIIYYLPPLFPNNS